RPPGASPPGAARESSADPFLELAVSFIASAHDVPSDRPHFAVWPRRLPRALLAPETSLWTNLEIAAQRYPDKVAYQFFGRALTYRELKAQAEAIAGWLQAE